MQVHWHLKDMKVQATWVIVMVQGPEGWRLGDVGGGGCIAPGFALGFVSLRCFDCTFFFAGCAACPKFSHPGYNESHSSPVSPSVLKVAFSDLFDQFDSKGRGSLGAADLQQLLRKVMADASSTQTRFFMVRRVWVWGLGSAHLSTLNPTPAKYTQPLAHRHASSLW